MLTKNEIEIIDVFRKDLFEKYTIHGLMKKSGRKTYAWTFNTVKKLAKMGIIKFEIKGRSKLCSINLYNHLTISYLSLLDKMKTASRKIPHLDELINEMPVSFFIFLIGGSYAEGKQTARSDLDVCVIVSDKINKRRIQNILDNKFMIPHLHPFVFRKSEFVNMLLNKEANYGKMLFKKHLIAFGAENYYVILREAIEHGFRG
jgi:predicted nucleotidyltransferase